METDSPEKDLLRGLYEAEQSAFQEVFVSYYPSLCLFAEKFIDSDVVEDVVEDVFLRLWQSPVQFENIVHLKSYLYRAVRNGCLNSLKQVARQGRRQYDFVESGDSFEKAYSDTIIETESFRLLYMAMAKLPVQARKIVELTYLQGKSNQEAADILKLSVNTVKFQKRRAVMLLKKQLGADPVPILVAFSASYIFF